MLFAKFMGGFLKSPDFGIGTEGLRDEGTCGTVSAFTGTVYLSPWPLTLHKKSSRIFAEAFFY